VLTRLALRRDRIILPAWVYVITALVAGTAYTFKQVYTPAARAQLRIGGGHNPALEFLYGRLYGTSVGALTAWRYGVWAAIFASVMTTMLVIRHTRADEETGRLELIGAGVVGRHTPLTVALAVAASADVVLTAAIVIALAFVGLPAAGAVALALAITGCSLAFACLAALAAQLTSGARAARGITLGALGVALAQWPAALAVAAVTVVLFGTVPRGAVAGGWTVVSATVLAVFFGPLLRFPQWLMDISPFTHAPKLPGAAVHAAPLLWLTLAAAVLAAAGLAALRRRNIG